MTLDTLVGYLPFLLGLVVTGAISGLFAGLLGIGGGAILVPALGYALSFLGYGSDLVQHVAVGTSLAIIIPTGIASARAHNRRGAVDFTILRLWVPPIVIATLIGSLMGRLYTGNALRIIFAALAVLIAANILLPFQERLMGHLRNSPTTHRIMAAIVGYASALMGVGGGSLSVPTIHAFGATMHQAVGTGAAIGVAIATAGTIGWIVTGWGQPGLPPLSLGYVNLPALALVGSIAAVTAPLGAELAHRMKQRTLKIAFAIFLLVVAADMLWKAVAG